MEEPFKLEWTLTSRVLRGRQRGRYWLQWWVCMCCDVSKSACNAVEYRCVFTVFLPFLHLGMFFKPQATSPLCECSHRWIHTKIHRHQLHHLPPTMSTHTSAPSTTTTTSLTKKKKTKKNKPQAQSLWDDLISNDIWKRPHRANKIKLRPCLFSVLEIC